MTRPDLELIDKLVELEVRYNKHLASLKLPVSSDMSEMEKAERTFITDTLFSKITAIRFALGFDVKL